MIAIFVLTGQMYTNIFHNKVSERIFFFHERYKFTPYGIIKNNFCAKQEII